MVVVISTSTTSTGRQRGGGRRASALAGRRREEEKKGLNGVGWEAGEAGTGGSRQVAGEEVNGEKERQEMESSWRWRR